MAAQATASRRNATARVYLICLVSLVIGPERRPTSAMCHAYEARERVQFVTTYARPAGGVLYCAERIMAMSRIA